MGGCELTGGSSLWSISRIAWFSKGEAGAHSRLATAIDFMQGLRRNVIAGVSPTETSRDRRARLERKRLKLAATILKHKGGRAASGHFALQLFKSAARLAFAIVNHPDSRFPGHRTRDGR